MFEYNQIAKIHNGVYLLSKEEADFFMRMLFDEVIDYKKDHVGRVTKSFDDFDKYVSGYIGNKRTSNHIEEVAVQNLL